MKQLLITIAALVLVGCGTTQQSAPAPEAKPVEPVAEVPAQPPSPVESQPAEPVAEDTQPEPPTAKAPDISIHDAAAVGNIEAVKEHLAAGTDINVKGELRTAGGRSFNQSGAEVSRGITPIQVAAEVGHTAIVELLLSKSADVNLKSDGTGWSALRYAVADYPGKTKAHQKKIVEQLIEKGADVNAEIRGVTLLDSVNKGGEIATLLRKHGGKTGEELIIQVAIIRGNFAAVKQHLATGVDVNTKNEQGRGWYLIHYAALDGHKEIVELLIAEGANVNAKANNGKTSLHNAAYRGHKEIAELLIANGADVNGKDFANKTPLDTSTHYEKPEITTLLREHGGKSGAEFSIHLAAELGNAEAVKQHLDAGVNVNAKDTAGGTPLFHAAYRGHKEIGELLIGKGADVNAMADNGVTPLDLAIKYNHPETADLLRKHGGKTGEELKAEGK